MSDLNLRSGLPAWMRLNGIWRKVTQRPITTDELLAALERLTKNNSVSALIKSGQSDYDFAHEIGNHAVCAAVFAATLHR